MGALYKKYVVCCNFIALFSALGCTKIVRAPEPVNSITTTEAFATEGNATSAVIAIYNDLISGGSTASMVYGNGLTTFNLGLSADELSYFYSYQTDILQFENNALQSNNLSVRGYFWNPAFFDVYLSNAAIEGLQSSTALSPVTKNQLTGEAKFLRAFCNFYLVNIFGDIPLVTTTNYAKTSLLAKASTEQVYLQMVNDLHDAQKLLPADYSVSGGQRYRANRWAATALLARVYLYQGNWVGADSAATAVINNTALYSLVPDLGSVFLANSNEAIWQLVPNTYSQYATWEGYQNLPAPLNSGNPTYFLKNTMLNAFEAGDLRRTVWVDSTNNAGTVYYFPYKYKVKTTDQYDITEYYMMLRLAEQYLIRAEAEANTPGEMSNAILDMDTIRNRAGLTGYTGPADQASVLKAMMHERQVELFSEWGHRWMDLKRWGNASSVLTSAKGFTVSSNQLLFPIPITELQIDPNLTQNSGY
jgi:hypothetical protein